MSIATEFVANGVPNGVEVVGSFAVRKINEIATKVTLWILVVDSGSGVQWLVQVADVMNEEAHGS